MLPPPSLSFALQGLTALHEQLLCITLYRIMLKLGRPFSATNQTLQPEEVAATQAMSFEDLLAEFQARNNSFTGNVFSSGSSKHRGVSWDKADGKWRAQFTTAPMRRRPRGPTIGLLTTSMEGMIHILGDCLG